MPKRQTSDKRETGCDADAFFDVFESARIRVGSIANATLQPGQLLAYPPSFACFHFVEDAPCLLRSGDERIVLQPGDMVVLPRGQAHELAAGNGDEPAPRITTCAFSFEGPGGTLLTGSLPAMLHVAGAGRPPAAFPDTPKEWLSVTLAAIRLEADRPWLGSSVMLSRLVDLLFVWSLRHWLVTAPPQAGGMARALDDAVVSRALALMHAQPAKDWSVESLARELNQSRSRLSQRFVQVLDEPPMRYLARWRMQLAADLLSSTKLRVSQIAQRVGYDSEPAFSRAFRRQFGSAPVDHRRKSKTR